MVTKFEIKDTTSPNYNKFLDDFVNPLVVSLEKNRRKYVKKLTIMTVISVCLLLLSLTLSSHIKLFVEDLVTFVHEKNLISRKVHTVVNELTKEGNEASSQNIKANYKNQINIFYYFICIGMPLISFWITFNIILKYKKGSVFAKNIKDNIFNTLINFFGDFEFSSKKGVSLYQMQESQIIPENLNYKSEDRITGKYNEVKIDMSESVFLERYNNSSVTVFKGLVILLDISSSDLILRGDFRGNTLIIQDDKKDLNYIKTKFSEYTTVSFPTPEIDKSFEILTNNTEEAKTIIDENLLKRIIKLSDLINATSDQRGHVDDKIRLLLNRFVHFLGGILGGIILAPFNIINIIKGNSLYPTLEGDSFNYEKHYKFFKEHKNKSASQLQAFNDDIQCSFYKDKVLITVPHKKNLFEPNSIFEPALIEEDVKILYDIMSLVKNICDDVVKNKNASNRKK